MMHRVWSSTVEVPYCFSRSYVKFQDHTALKIVEFDPNWAFPDSNSSLNSLMAMKCCTKLETAKERCPIVFQGHPSNFKVTRDKTSPILTQIGRFRTIGRSQLSNPSDLPCFVLCAGVLLHVEFSPCQNRLGGSALAQCYQQLGNQSPDLDDALLFARAFTTTQRLVKGKPFEIFGVAWYEFIQPSWEDVSYFCLIIYLIMNLE